MSNILLGFKAPNTILTLLANIGAHSGDMVDVTY